MITSKDLWDVGAEPIDITAARLLSKTPWWAKQVESIQECRVDETTFMRNLATLYRDCRRSRTHKVGGMQEFCDLATMARKVRWKFADDRPGFGQKYFERLKWKMAQLEWNPLICRFEVARSQLPRSRSRIKAERVANRCRRDAKISEVITKSLE